MRMHQLPPSGRAAVYVLQRIDRRCFKVGWALDPMQRVRQLPEYDALQLDLDHSVALWLPSRKRAEQIERAVHKALAPYAADARHHATGHSEWFGPVAHPVAVRMLAQMPTSERSDARGRLEPLTLQAPRSDGVSQQTGAQEVWWALEDLWARLATCCPVSVDGDGEVHQLVLVGFRHAREGDVAALRQHVFDTETYTWRAAGQRGEFVRLLEYRGDDLVCTLTTLRRIDAWPDGKELIWQVKGLLLRLQRSMTRRRMATTHAGSAHEPEHHHAQATPPGHRRRCLEPEPQCRAVLASSVSGRADVAHPGVRWRAVHAPSDRTTARRWARQHPNEAGAPVSKSEDRSPRGFGSASLVARASAGAQKGVRRQPARRPTSTPGPATA
jgi:hypothetical protein